MPTDPRPTEPVEFLRRAEKELLETSVEAQQADWVYCTYITPDSEALEIRPEVIAYDLHPDYFSTKWALQQSGVKLVGVQHHHAHIASCMAENHLEGRVIGFALDGTGYGTDGHIWGGEVLIAGYEEFDTRHSL